MITIKIINSLRDEIYKTFKKESRKVYSLIAELELNPNKGKKIGKVGAISIRELEFKSFRFYFILDSFKLYLFNKKKLAELLIKFIAMSKKHNQQKTINQIKEILKIIK